MKAERYVRSIAELFAYLNNEKPVPGRYVRKSKRWSKGLKPVRGKYRPSRS